jgi:phage terminase large subunit GpA-like protein
MNKFRQSTCPYCDFNIVNDVKDHYSSCNKCPQDIKYFCVKNDINIQHEHNLNCQGRKVWIDYMQDKIRTSGVLTTGLCLPISVWMTFN